MPNATVTVVATLNRSADALRLWSVRNEADWLEHRADSAPDVEAAWLRQHFPGQLLFTLRSRREGGASDLDLQARWERLRGAAREYDLVDLETHDLVPAVLDAIPPERRVISWEGTRVTGDELARRFHHVSATPAQLYRLVVHARASGDELAPLQLLRVLGREDVAAFGAGAIGLWTRLIAPLLGGPFVFASIDDAGNGVPTVRQMATDYGYPHLGAVDEIFGIVGDPVLGSLSPRIHNAVFRALGRRALYVPFHAPSFPEFWARIVAPRTLDDLGFRLSSLCVVSPHKESALAATQARSSIVERSRSTNFFIRQGDVWTAATTDPEGVLDTLRERGVGLVRERVAVIGCGGSGRAVATALADAGAIVTLVNRGPERGLRAASLLQLPYRPLSGFSPEGFSIVVNATPVGRDGDEVPFAVDRLHPDTVIVDLVYREKPTHLVAGSRRGGRVIIDGRDVLMAQASRQYRLMTGQPMPEPLVRVVLGLESKTLAAAAGP